MEQQGVANVHRPQRRTVEQREPGGRDAPPLVSPDESAVEVAPDVLGASEGGEAVGAGQVGGGAELR